ncbi:MAG: helix-hairpin-helix domain-containing protein [bacterium]
MSYLTSHEKKVLLFLVFIVLTGIIIKLITKKQSDTLFISLNNSIQQKSTTNGQIDINTATLNDLRKLPGVGITIGKRIITYRDSHQNFNSVDELLKIKGIGRNKIKKIKEVAIIN